jgi:hypothetical protein
VGGEHEKGIVFDVVCDSEAVRGREVHGEMLVGVWAARGLACRSGASKLAAEWDSLDENVALGSVLEPSSGVGCVVALVVALVVAVVGSVAFWLAFAFSLGTCPLPRWCDVGGGWGCEEGAKGGRADSGQRVVLDALEVGGDLCVDIGVEDRAVLEMALVGGVVGDGCHFGD